MSQFAGFRAKRERGTEEERSARASDTSRFESGIDNGNCIIHSASSAVNARRRLAFADVTSRPRHIREPPRVKDDGGRRRRVSPSARHADEHGGNIRAPLPLFPTTSTIDMIGPLSRRVSVSRQRDGGEEAAFPRTSPSLVSPVSPVRDYYFSSTLRIPLDRN